MVLRLTDSP
jgi:hypothetical protein